MKPTLKTLKRLFALSGNECAILGCSEPQIDSEHGVIVGEAAHIKGENPGSARYDPDQSEEERRAFENLIAVCRKHHKIIDERPDSYTVELLMEYKQRHEARFSVEREGLPIQVPEIGELLYLDKEGERAHVPYWVDNDGHPHVYTPEQWEQVDTIREIATEIGTLKGAPWSKSRTNEHSQENVNVKILQLMADVPDAKFADILRFAVKGGGDELIAQRAREKRARL